MLTIVIDNNKGIYDKTYLVNRTLKEFLKCLKNNLFKHKIIIINYTVDSKLFVNLIRNIKNTCPYIPIICLDKLLFYDNFELINSETIFYKDDNISLSELINTVEEKLFTREDKISIFDFIKK